MEMSKLTDGEWIAAFDGLYENLCYAAPELPLHVLIPTLGEAGESVLWGIFKTMTVGELGEALERAKKTVDSRRNLIKE